MKNNKYKKKDERRGQSELSERATSGRVEEVAVELEGAELGLELEELDDRARPEALGSLRAVGRVKERNRTRVVAHCGVHLDAAKGAVEDLDLVALKVGGSSVAVGEGVLRDELERGKEGVVREDGAVEGRATAVEKPTGSVPPEVRVRAHTSVPEGSSGHAGDIPDLVDTHGRWGAEVVGVHPTSRVSFSVEEGGVGNPSFDKSRVSVRIRVALWRRTDKDGEGQERASKEQGGLHHHCFVFFLKQAKSVCVDQSRRWRRLLFVALLWG